MTEIIFPQVLKLFYQRIFNSVQNGKHVKIECIGLKLDRGRSTRRGRVGLGQLAHVGGRVARIRAYFGPTLASVVFGSLLSEFRGFLDRIPSCCRGVSPTLVFLYTFMHNM